MGKIEQFVLGCVLSLIGVIIFLTNVRINTSSIFYRYGRINVGGILLVLIVVVLADLVVKPRKVTVFILITLFIVFIISVVLAIDIRIIGMSAFELILILGTIGIGTGLLIKVLLSSK